MADLNTFKTRMGGGVRPNQFRVEVPFLGEDLKFLCHTAGLPASHIGQATTFYRGRMIPLAGERSFDPWTIIVYTDQAFSIRNKLEAWSNSINDYASNVGSTNPMDYKKDAKIHHLHRNSDTPIKSYTIRGIFPIQIGEVQLSWQQNDVVEEFTVTFAVEDVIPGDIGAVGDTTLASAIQNTIGL